MEIVVEEMEVKAEYMGWLLDEQDLERPVVVAFDDVLEEYIGGRDVRLRGRGRVSGCSMMYSRNT